MKKLTLRHFNDGLTLVVVVLCLYVVLAPFVPNLSFWWKKSVTKDVPPIVAALENPDPQKPEIIPEKNTLVIPRLNLEQELYESRDQSALKKGVWRYPHASTPDQGMNTVLIGHRFTYGGPAVFYHLDKVQVGDVVVVYWNQQKYEYHIESVDVVPPSMVDIQRRDIGQETLTIYTCTPLVTAQNRLVIRAVPVESNEDTP